MKTSLIIGGSSLALNTSNKFLSRYLGMNKELKISESEGNCNCAMYFEIETILDKICFEFFWNTRRHYIKQHYVISEREREIRAN